MKRAATGWSKNHELYNSNGFYAAHPQIWTPKVEVEYPEHMQALAQWQAERSMFHSMPEIRWLDDILRLRFPLESPPLATLDLACGVGRASVYFAKHFSWHDCHFHMWDSKGENPTYGSFETAGENTYYNDMALTEEYLKHNEIRHYTLHDANNLTTLNDVRVELAYSFLAFGYHFKLSQVWPLLKATVKPGGLVVFGVKGFDAGSGLAGRIYNHQQRMLTEVDQRDWKLIRDARGPERMKCSVFIFERRDSGKRQSWTVAPEINSL